LLRDLPGPHRLSHQVALAFRLTFLAGPHPHLAAWVHPTPRRPSMARPNQDCLLAPVRPDALVTCYHIAQSALWARGFDTGGDIEVQHRGRTLRIGAADPIGRMMGSVRNYLLHLEPGTYPAVSGRLLLLFDLARGLDGALTPWLRIVEGRMVLHDSLLRAAAVTPVTGADVPEFDLEDLIETSRRFDRDWGMRYPQVSWQNYA
jgi:hypothetical protein